MKKIILIFCIFICFGFYSYINKEFYPEDKNSSLYFGVLDNKWNNVWTYASGTVATFTNYYQVFAGEWGINLISSGTIRFKPFNVKESQIEMWLPFRKNGAVKIKCSLWFCPLTQTLKASPVNAGTCGGFE